MRHAHAYRKLNRTSEHRKALLANMAASLVKHEQLITTLPKARALRPYTEKLVSAAKKGGLANRRRVYGKLQQEMSVKKLFDVLAPRYAARSGGYVRVLKAGYRYGDNAPLAVIEFVERDVSALGQNPTQSQKNESSANAKADKKPERKGLSAAKNKATSSRS